MKLRGGIRIELSARRRVGEHKPYESATALVRLRVEAYAKLGAHPNRSHEDQARGLQPVALITQGTLDLARRFLAVPPLHDPQPIRSDEARIRQAWNDWYRQVGDRR
jgi:hypothetical protein